MQTKHPPIVVEESFDASKETVWRAITDQEQMIQWYFEDIPSFLPELGFETQFGVQSGERLFTHQWKIIDVIPLKKIEYSWRYQEYPGDASVSWELIEEGKQTRLKLTCIGIESFPQDILEFTRESCMGGWQYFIQERLKNHIENKETQTD